MVNPVVEAANVSGCSCQSHKGTEQADSSGEFAPQCTLPSQPTGASPEFKPCVDKVVNPFDIAILKATQQTARAAGSQRLAGIRRRKRARKHKAPDSDAMDVCPESPTQVEPDDKLHVEPEVQVQYKLKQSVLDKLQEVVARPFTLGTGQDQTCNAVSATVCKIPDEFLQTDLAGHTIWLDPPPNQTYDLLKHYVESKDKSPEISAVILVPHKLGPYEHMLKGMQRIAVYNRRNAMFETTDGLTVPLSKEKVAVYYDPPYTTDKLNLRGAPTMTFVGTANRYNAAISVYEPNAVLAVDTQASTSFVSTQWLKRAGVTHAALPSPNLSNLVELADGRQLRPLGKVSIRIRIGSMTDTVVCQVLDMPGFDIILGDDWLLQRRVHLDFGNKCAFVYTKGKRHTVKSAPARFTSGEGVKAQDKGSAKAPMFLTALQVKRIVSRRERAFLVQVVDSKDQPCKLAVLQEVSGSTSSAQLQSLLTEYDDVFGELKELPPKRPIAHVIPLEPGAKPIFKNMYRLTPKEKAEVERQIKDLLAKGLIEPSSSPWGAPVLFVPKQDGSLRMCIDYRALNKVTVKNRYPIPRIDDLLEQLQGAKCFSNLDLSSGYWQIRIDDQDIEKTAFRTHVGHYQWRVLSFGLTNCPSTFQQLMNQIFKEYLGKFVIIYLDDILIFSPTPEAHLEHLRLVLDKLRTNKLYVKKSKCHFNLSEITFLGHVVGPDGVKVDPRKVQAVQSWPVPQDIHQLRSFLGLANYFRKFIQGYSSLVRPLTDLLRSEANVSKDWSPAAQAAFEGVKWALTHAPVLVLPDFNAVHTSKPFEVVADASLHGVGAVLLQGGRPIAFESKKFTPAESNYDTSQRELLALIHALKIWRCYLEDVPFILVTDHHPNTFFETQQTMSPRMARWYEFLTRFSHVKWEYRPGRSNVADPLSRVEVHKLNAMILRLAVLTRYGGKKHVPLAREAVPPTTAGPAVDPVLPAAVAKQTRFMPPLSREMTPEPPMAFDPREEEERVAKLTDRIQRAYAYDSWFAESENLKTLVQRHDLYWKVLSDGSQVLVIPDHDGLRTEIIHECHATPWSGHVGLHKTLKLAERTFWWPNMRADIEKHVLTCESCQRNKSSSQKPAGLLKPMPIPGRRWETVTMDLITGLPVTESGRDAVTVFVDKLSKMVRLVPCNTTDGALEVAQYFVEHIFRSHGLPKVLVSDRDPRFTSNLFSEIAKMLKCKQALSSAFHPETDGQTERINRVVEEMLRHYASPRQDDWDKYLYAVEFAINNSYQESVQNTPFFLNYGQHPLTPVEVQLKSDVPAALQFTVGMQAAVKHAKQLLAGAQDRQKTLANEKRREVVYAPGEYVWLNPKHLVLKTPGTRKLLPRFVGPYEVLERVGEVAYRLKLPKNTKIHNVFHVSLLKPCRLDSEAIPKQSSLIEFDTQAGYQVEMVLTHRERPSPTANDPAHVTKTYLVKYADRGPEYNAWVSEKSLQRDYPNILAQYWAELTRRQA